MEHPSGVSNLFVLCFCFCIFLVGAPMCLDGVCTVRVDGFAGVLVVL